MALTRNLEELSTNNKIIDSGKQGDEVLSFFKETADLVNGQE